MNGDNNLFIPPFKYMRGYEWSFEILNILLFIVHCCYFVLILGISLLCNKLELQYIYVPY